ncbi:MAG: acetate/propionate family kinase [Aquificaceae bacterium]
MRTFLSLNYGSSSLKVGFFVEEEPLLRESHKATHLEEFKKALINLKAKLKEKPQFLAHRVVHGMDYKGPMEINKDTLPLLERLATLNPLHNLIAFHCIKVSLELFPESKHYALFDTDFHKTLPLHAQLYALSWDMYHRGIKRYGFHGISYSYLLERAKEILKKEGPNLILMHLGSGCSVCAIKEGISIDTSMGFSPLEGLPMATRPGDLDPGILLYLLKDYPNPEELEKLLYYNSGIKGLWGRESFEEVVKAKETDQRAKVVFDLFLHRLLKYVGAYWFLLEGSVDALVFSGGIGENSPQVRHSLCEKLRPFGVEIDPRKNQEGDTLLSTENSKVKVLLIRTDEELHMVQILKRVIESPTSS